MPPDRGEQLWLELPPISAEAPPRLLIFLHDAGWTPDRLAPVAIAWQMKFPGATAVLLQGMRPVAGGSHWYDPADRDERGAVRMEAAAAVVADRVERLRGSMGLDVARTVLVGFGQGATLALELARTHPALAGIVVAYAGRLNRPMREGDRVVPTVHLIHGEFDSVIPAIHSARAFHGLRAVGADVTLDIVEDESHSIGQGLVNLGTARVMQTVFRGRRRAGRLPTLH